MLMFSLPGRRQGKTAALAADALKPADYVRLRRQAAGLSRRDVASRLAALALQPMFQGATRMVRLPEDEALALIDQLETPGVRARHRATIAAIAAVIPVDVDVYRQLALDPPERHPTICRGCGCTPNDPCTGEDGVCSIGLRGTCTRCADQAEAA